MEIQITSLAPSPSSSPQDSLQGSPAGGSNGETVYDGWGRPIVVDGGSFEKHYDDKGFLITSGAALNTQASPTQAAQNQIGSDNSNSSGSEAVAASESSAVPSISKSTSRPDSAAPRNQGVEVLLGAVCITLAGVISL